MKIINAGYEILTTISGDELLKTLIPIVFDDIIVAE